MVVMATVSLAVFKRKTFCRHFCPVGRTIGFYSQLSAVELRPINTNTCAECKTVECYHCKAEVEPCPTWLVMGSLKQNSYCISCGNCSQSCPDNNVAWRLRTPSIEAIQGARPRWDEAWFMMVLLALTAFHGITMMPFWTDWISDLARLINDSGTLLFSFSLGLIATLVLIIGLYAVLIMLTGKITNSQLSFKRRFSTMAFIALPLAFSYHMAHNLNHLIREGGGLWNIITNPLGTGMLPLTGAEKHQRHFEMWFSEEVLYGLQAGLMILGFIIALQTIRHRGVSLLTTESAIWQLSPMLLFAISITCFHLWMLMQPMIMRM
jgi:ferredoxin